MENISLDNLLMDIFVVHIFELLYWEINAWLSQIFNRYSLRFIAFHYCRKVCQRISMLNVIPRWLIDCNMTELPRQPPDNI